MGKMVKWTKAKGWQVGPTPYVYYLQGLYEFRQHQFSGSRAWYNRPRRRKEKLV
jgi:hypothetical protein